MAISFRQDGCSPEGDSGLGDRAAKSLALLLAEGEDTGRSRIHRSSRCSTGTHIGRRRGSPDRYPGRARDERKERQWQRRIDQWRVSGLSVRAFCAQHGLAQASFYAWRRVLERRAAEQPAFVPVQVVADATPADQASALEVLLLDGRTVRVAPGFDA